MEAKEEEIEFDAQKYDEFIDQQIFYEEYESETYCWDEFISWESINDFTKGWKRWIKIEAQQRRRIISGFQNQRCREKSTKTSLKRRKFKMKGFLGIFNF